jgi:plastocyanin
MTTVVILLDSDQRFGGTLTFHEEIHLNETGDAFQGTFNYEVKNANGEVTSSGEGETKGNRVLTESDTATPQASPSTSSDGISETTVSIRDFAFDPPSVELPVGKTVTWTNEGQAPHTATALDGTFDTGQLDQGQQGQFTFDQAGSYNYRCDFHPEMQGTIVVT